MSFQQKVRMLYHNIGGWSHLRLAKHLGVSIRQIQRAIDPDKRRQQDRAWERARRAG